MLTATKISLVLLSTLLWNSAVPAILLVILSNVRLSTSTWMKNKFGLSSSRYYRLSIIAISHRQLHKYIPNLLIVISNQQTFSLLTPKLLKLVTLVSADFLKTTKLPEPMSEHRFIWLPNFLRIVAIMKRLISGQWAASSMKCAHFNHHMSLHQWIL